MRIHLSFFRSQNLSKMIGLTKTWVKYNLFPLYLYLQGNVINFRILLFVHCILWHWAVKETIVGLRNKTSCQKFWIALDMMYCYVISYPPICAAHFKGYFSWERILERQTISILSVMVETLTLNYTIKYILREIDPFLSFYIIVEGSKFHLF